MNNGSLRPFASVVDILFHPQICLSHLSIPSVQQTSGLWNFMLVSLLPLFSCGHRTFLHAEAQFFHIYLDLGIHAGHLFSAGLLRKHNCARAMWTAGVRLHYRFCETSVVPCTGLFLVSKYQKAWAVTKHSIGFYRIFSAQLDRNNGIALWSCCETCFWDMTCLVYKPRSFERVGYCVQTSTLNARAACATRATCQGKRFRRFPRGQGVASSLFSTKAAGFVTPKFASFLRFLAVSYGSLSQE